MAAEPTGTPQQISAALQEVTDRAQAIVREEIELAKTEITEKLQRLVRGAVIAAVAGVFVIAAMVLILHGFAWLAWWLLPTNKGVYFWGFFIVAAILLILGGVAGFVAARLFKKATPPTPQLAIEEAQRVRETVRQA